MIRSNKEILDAYHGNKYLSSEDINRLYEIEPDPWNLTGPRNLDTVQSILSVHKGLDEVDLMIDFGCGAGAWGLVTKAKEYCGIDQQSVLLEMKKKLPGAYGYVSPTSPAPEHLASIMGLMLQSGKVKKLSLIMCNSIYYLWRNPNPEVTRTNPTHQAGKIVEFLREFVNEYCAPNGVEQVTVFFGNSGPDIHNPSSKAASTFKGEVENYTTGPFNSSHIEIGNIINQNENPRWSGPLSYLVLEVN